MIKLTDKENKLVQYFLDKNDDSDCHLINEKEFLDHKELGWSFKVLEGVFGSIISKGLLQEVDENDFGIVYQWAYPVSFGQHGNSNYEIKTTAEYLTAFENEMDREKIEKLEKENQ